MKASKKRMIGAISAINQKINIKDINMPARSSMFFTAINLMSKGAAFIFTPLFTRLLTPMEYGQFSLFSSYLSVAIVIVSLELPGGVIMRALQKERQLHHLSLTVAACLCAVLAIPTVAILLAIKQLFGGGMDFPFSYLFLFFSLISLSMINLYISKCKFLYKWIPSLIVALLQSVAAPIISIVLIRMNYFKSFNHVTTKIGTVTTVLTLIAIFIAVLCVKKSLKEIKTTSMSKTDVIGYIKSTAVYLVKLSLPLLPYYFSIMLISQADKLLISRFLGETALGKYSVAYSAGISLTAVTGGIMGALSPWLMRKARAEEFGKIRETLDSFISITALLITVFLSAAPNVFEFLAPEEYRLAMPVMFIIALIPIPLSLAQCMSSIAIAEEKVRGILISGIFPAALVLMLDIIFIRGSALYVPAIITASGYFLLMILNVINTSRITGKSLINVNKTFQKLAFLIFSSMLLFAFREQLPIRVTVAVIALIALGLMAKKLLALITEPGRKIN